MSKASETNTNIIEQMRGLTPKDQERVVKKMKAMIAKNKYKARKEAEADD